MTYNMGDFLSSCVDRYFELAGNGVKLRTVANFFLVEDQGTSTQGAPSHPGPFSECAHLSCQLISLLNANWQAAVTTQGNSTIVGGHRAEPAGYL